MTRSASQRRSGSAKHRWLIPVLLGTLATCLAVTGVAYAYWHASGTGTAHLTTGTLNPPTNVTASSATAGSATISWTASTGTPSPTGYDVTRTDTAAGTTADVCGTPAALVTATACTDTGVAPGTYTYQVTAIYHTWTAPSMKSNSVDIMSAASRLAFTVQPANAVAGAGISPAIAVTVEDSSGKPVAAANVAVSLAIGTNPGSGALAGTTTTTTNVSGVATFTGVSIATAGTGYTVTASSPGLTGATSTAFSISAGPASKLVFTTKVSGSQAATATATIGPFAVQAQDFFGNPVTAPQAATLSLATTSTGTTFFTVSSGGFTASAVTIAAGATTSATFFYADNKAGAASLTANATLNGIALQQASANVTVTAAAAARFAVAAPSTATAGTAFDTITLTAQDAFGNTVTGYANGTHTIAWSGATASAAGTAPGYPTSVVSFTAGVSTTPLSATLVAAGLNTLTATDSGISGSAPVLVSPGAAASLALSAGSLTPVAGVADNLTVTALDAYGNTATGYTGDKALTFGGAAAIGLFVPTVSNKSGAATSFGSSTTLTFTAGVAAVSGANNGVMKLYKAGAATITVTDGAISSATGLAVTVSPAAASKLTLSSCTLNGTATTCGSSFALGNSGSLSARVQLLDQFGNAAPTAGLVTLAVTSGNTSTYSVTGSPLTIDGTVTPASQSGSAFTVQKLGSANNSTTITVHATSGQQLADLTFTVQK